MKALIDNERDDEYFYQVLVFTGQRKEAATKSKVRLMDGEGETETPRWFQIYFVLSGDEHDTGVRRLRTDDQSVNKRLFGNGNIDSFLLSTPKFVLSPSPSAR